MWVSQSSAKQNKMEEALQNRIKTAEILLKKDAISVVDQRANVSLQLHLHCLRRHINNIHFPLAI